MYHWPDIASRVRTDEIFVVLHQIEIKQFGESTSLGGLTDEQIVGLGKLWSDVTNAHIKLHGQRSKRRQPLGRAFYVVPLQWVATSQSSWAPNPSSPSINSSKSAAAQPQQFRPRTHLSTRHVCHVCTLTLQILSAVSQSHFHLRFCCTGTAEVP
jgi:hypothetical protein